MRKWEFLGWFGASQLLGDPQMHSQPGAVVALRSSEPWSQHCKFGVVLFWLLLSPPALSSSVPGGSGSFLSVVWTEFWWAGFFMRVCSLILEAGTKLINFPQQLLWVERLFSALKSIRAPPVSLQR